MSESELVELTSEDRRLLASIRRQEHKLLSLYREIGEGPSSLGKVAMMCLQESVQAAEAAVKLNRNFLKCG